MSHYTGIGSRQTPGSVLAVMTMIAMRLARRGWVLRSGGAEGADSAFEKGADEAGGKKEIYVPWKGFAGRKMALVTGDDAAAAELAAGLHPAWARLSPPVRRLHTRNVHQVLGRDLCCASQFVVCWTADGCETASQRTAKTGGTGMAIALASSRGVPVINLRRGIDEAMMRIGSIVNRDQDRG